MVQEKKRAQFSELSEEKKRIVSKRCFDVTLECNFRGSLIKEKYNFASSQFILDKAKYYVDNFATSSEKIDYINRKNEYDNLAKSNGIYYREDTKYQQYIIEISKIEDMDELNEYIKGKNPSGKEIPIHSLNLAISDRTRALGDKDGLYSSVKDKLLAYGKYKYEKRMKQNKDKYLLTLEENKLLSKITLQDFLDSEFIYKQDYCKERGLSVNTFDKRTSNVKEFDAEFFQEYQNSLSEKRQKYYDTLKPVVEDILENINSDKDYNIIDYYLSYKDLYTFEDLCQSCNKHKMDIRALKTFFSKVDVRSTLSYDSFVSQRYTAFGHEYSEAEKEELYKYAKDNCIPFNWHNVSLLVAKNNANKNKNRAA
jgi:hypothetical protein